MGITRILITAAIGVMLNAPIYARSKGIVTHATITVYHPVKSQTDDSPTVTADGSHIDMRKLKSGKIRWCAVSRDLLWLFPKGKPKRVLIEGWGIYEVRDTMNARHTHRVDILLHPSDKRRTNEYLKVIILQ